MPSSFARNWPSVIEHLGRANAADHLLPTATRLAELQDDLRRILPASLSRRFHAHLGDGDALVVQVPSAALATKLRQTTSSLREGLLARGWKVSAIQIRVQPEFGLDKSTTYRERRTHVEGLDAALGHWQTLLEGVEDPALADAIGRLIARRKKS